MDVPIKPQTVFAHTHLTLTREGRELLEKNVTEGSVILPPGFRVPDLEVKEHGRSGIAALMVLSGYDLGFTVPTPRSTIYDAVAARYSLALMQPHEVWGYVGVRHQRPLSGVTMWASEPFSHWGESKLFGLSYHKGGNHQLSQVSVLLQPGDENVTWEPGVRWIFNICNEQ